MSGLGMWEIPAALPDPNNPSASSPSTYSAGWLSNPDIWTTAADPSKVSNQFGYLNPLNNMTKPEYVQDPYGQWTYANTTYYIDPATGQQVPISSGNAGGNGGNGGAGGTGGGTGADQSGTNSNVFSYNMDPLGAVANNEILQAYGGQISQMMTPENLWGVISPYMNQALTNIGASGINESSYAANQIANAVLQGYYMNQGNVLGGLSNMAAMQQGLADTQQHAQDVALDNWQKINL